MKILTSFFFVFILALSQILPAAQVDTVDIYSKKMDKSHRAIVVVPEADTQTEFPVVYLLHGWSGNYRNWFDKANLPQLSDHYQMILVCPDGGYAGWYLDSPLKKDSQYESYIVFDVVTYVDEYYPTIADSSGRAICGLSMGGYGALRLLSKHPQRFTAGGSMSGVMELTSYESKYGLTELIGILEENSERWNENAAINLVKNLTGKQKGIILDCGISDRFIEGNRRMHQKLLLLKIEHDYYERPGGHRWDYWVNALDYHLLFFKKYWDK